MQFVNLLCAIDEVPVSELQFYARHLSNAFIVLVIITIIEIIFFFEIAPTVLGWGCTSMVCMSVNVVGLRAVAEEQTPRRVNLNIIFAIGLLMFWSIWLIYGLCKRWFTPLYAALPGPLVMIIMQGITVFILFKFRGKVELAQQNEEDNMNTKLVDTNVIHYEH